MKESIKQILIKVKARELSIDNGCNQILKLIEKEFEAEREHDQAWDDFKSGDMK
jgi:hypothetical protein